MSLCIPVIAFFNKFPNLFFYGFFYFFNQYCFLIKNFEVKDVLTEFVPFHVERLKNGGLFLIGHPFNFFDEDAT